MFLLCQELWLIQTQSSDVNIVVKASIYIAMFKMYDFTLEFALLQVNKKMAHMQFFDFLEIGPYIQGLI